MAPLIFASPHSGSIYPTAFQQDLKAPLIDLRRTEDAYVDELFSCVPEKNLALIAAVFGRCYVDVNRDAREVDRDMFVDSVPSSIGVPTARVRAGLGCLPRVGASGLNIHRELLTWEEGARRLAEVHEAYHGALQAEFEQLKQNWSDVVLIDCHSMPSNQPGRSNLPDIVLGDRFGSSCAGRLTNRVERTCRKLGLSVVRNAPYAGGYTTRRYGRPARGVHVLQIEINRGLYLDEVAVKKTDRFEVLQSKLDSIVDEIIDFTRQEND